MRYNFEGWGQAPENATHFCVKDCVTPWLRDIDGMAYYYEPNIAGGWGGYATKVIDCRHFDDAIPKPERFENVHNHKQGFDWKKAPPGATHILYETWRKIMPEGCDHWDVARQEWKPSHAQLDGPGFIERWGRDLVVAPWFKGFPAVVPEVKVELAPPPPVIQVLNGVEVDWSKAPEGTTHCCVYGGLFQGWRKVTEEGRQARKAGDLEWGRITHHGVDMADYLRINRNCIFPKPVLVVVPAPEKPEPVKKPVGWWS